MAADPNPSGLHDLSEALSEIVAKAAPGIVSFGRGRGRASGFVWRQDLVVTSDEAVSEGDTFPVTVAGGQTVEAKLIGRDSSTDIALLRIDGSDLRPISLDASLPRVGSIVVAVGALEGYPTAALGVVSRAEGPWTSLRGGEIDARIVFDLRLPTGAEGGLVFDADGNVVGMSVFGPRRRVIAIPTATIERVASQLERHGRIPRGYLGVGLYPVTVNGSERPGAIVINVDPKGPSVAAGLRQGDVIVNWNGQPIGRIPSLSRSLGPSSVGQTVTLDVRRGGEAIEVRVAIAERPAA